MAAPIRQCPLCGSSDCRPFIRTNVRSSQGGTFDVVTCARCSLRYTTPLPTAEEFATLYEDEYYKFAYDPAKGEAAKGRGQQAGRRQFASLGIRLLTLVFTMALLEDRRRALLDLKLGRVLDVGCGSGDFLRFLKRRGWDVQGVEFSEEAAALARAKSIPVHRGELASADFPDNSFDVVTLWHVAEHLPHPRAELAEIRRILRDNGLLVLEVPNSACLTLQLCGTHWRQLDVPRHLQHFTPATMERLLNEAGFDVVRQQDFHFIDFDLAFYSFTDRLGISRLSGIRYFSTDFKEASRASKLLFLSLGLPIAALSVPYSILAPLLKGNGENLTVTARKTAR
jgi:SAM-dependent methyltransferase